MVLNQSFWKRNQVQKKGFILQSGISLEDNQFGANEHSQEERKQVLVGTHRVCPPEETLERVRPFLPHMGITRLAELTQLDELGIPVFQAIRPNSRNLSTSQGKGITRALAKTSAVMESIESWHAEDPQLPTREGTIRDLAPDLPYSVYDLLLTRYHLLHDESKLEWFPATLIGKRDTTWVPAELLRLNFTAPTLPLFPSFQIASNGLASGNTRDEAVLHGLYEVIERDTLARMKTGEASHVLIDPLTVDGAASRPLIDRLLQADANFTITYALGPTGLPCFEVALSSHAYPIQAKGSGCHLDRDVALSRALTEAAQYRLSIISGARDDISRQVYQQIRHRQTSIFTNEAVPGQSFNALPSASSFSLQTDLAEVLCRLDACISSPPMMVDLTRPEFTIPVVFVLVPTFRLSEAR